MLYFKINVNKLLIRKTKSVFKIKSLHLTNITNTLINNKRSLYKKNIIIVVSVSILKI